jgi:SSS family solute:Na+ symporter
VDRDIRQLTAEGPLHGGVSSGYSLLLMDPFVPVLGIYLLVILAVGIAGAVRVRTPADFWIAGGRASAVATGGSLAATIVGGSGTLGLAGLAFSRGLTGSWWLLVGPVGLFALMFFLKTLKSRPVYTLPELIGGWYGPAMARIAGLFIVVAWLGIVGAQAAAAGRILSTFFGGQTRWWTLAAGAVFVAYTVSGGQVSVIRTDLLQVLLISAGLGLCAVAGLQLSGGFARLSAGLPASFFVFPVSPGFSGLDLAVLLLVVGSTYLVGPDMLSRVFSARNVRSARRAILLAVCVIIPVAIFVTFTGLSARFLYPETTAEAALPVLAKHALPPWLSALTMIALLSAFLSSADTTLLTMSAILTIDFFSKKHCRSLAVPRLAVSGCGTAAVFVGIYSGGIIPSLLLGYSVFAGGLFVPVLAGLLGKPLRICPAITAAILGGLCALAGKLVGSDLLVAGSFAIGLTVWTADRVAVMLQQRRSRAR